MLNENLMFETVIRNQVISSNFVLILGKCTTSMMIHYESATAHSLRVFFLILKSFNDCARCDSVCAYHFLVPTLGVCWTCFLGWKFQVETLAFNQQRDWCGSSKEEFSEEFSEEFYRDCQIERRREANGEAVQTVVSSYEKRWFKI